MTLVTNSCTVPVAPASVSTPTFSPSSPCATGFFTSTGSPVSATCTAVMTKTPSTATTPWSDGDRERPPTAALICGAASCLTQVVMAGDAALRRKSKPETADTISALLGTLVDTHLLSAHVLVCCVSLVTRVSAAVPRSVSTITMRRVIAACALLAAKAEADEVVTLAYYAEVTGISADMIKCTEAQIFERLGYNVGTTASDFHRALAAMIMLLPDTDDIDYEL